MGTPVILMVDDDQEDVYLTKRAFSKQDRELKFDSVSNGAQLFDYLGHKRLCTASDVNHSPSIILLDINIPNENGFEILRKLKQNSQHSHIPILMYSTSSADSDIRKAYQLGASSYITKTMKEMNALAEQLCIYWFGFTYLPSAA